MYRVAGALILGANFLASGAFANHEPEVYTYNTNTYDPSHSSFTFSWGNVLLNPEKAFQERVDDTATYLKGAFTTRTQQNWVWGIGLSAFIYDDLDPFTEAFVDCCGDVYYEQSNAGAINVFGEIGYGFDLTPTLSFDLVTGYEAVLWSSREIADCYDCYSESIDLDGGAYVSPRLTFVSDSGFTIGVSAQNYLDGDIERAYSVNLGFRF